MTIFIRRLTVSVALILLSAGAQSAVVVTAIEDGAGVVFSVESGGSLDISGMLFGLTLEADNIGAIRPEVNALRIGGGDYTVYQGISGSAFGPGTGQVADSYTGDLGAFGFGGDELYVTAGYVSGSQIGSGSIFFAGETFASLGITPDVYVYTLMGSNDTITLNAVPVPAAVWLFGSALVGLGWMRRKQTG